MLSPFKESFHFQTVCCLDQRPPSVQLLLLLLLDVLPFFWDSAQTQPQQGNTLTQLVSCLSPCESSWLPEQQLSLLLLVVSIVVVGFPCTKNNNKKRHHYEAGPAYNKLQ